MRRLGAVAMVALALVPVSAVAGQVPAIRPAPAASRQAVADLAPVMVTGVQPGPGLWRISKPGRVLWILGTTSPLPHQLQWQSRDVAAALAQAQVLLDPPAVKMKLDTGFFGKLWLLPTLIGVRNNPQHKTLREVVAPADYARWQVLKQRYLGDSDKVERWRPIFAAYQLYRKALQQHGLDGSGEVLARVRQLAAEAHLERESTTLTVLIEQPRHLVQSFKRSEVDDASCFAQTLANLDADMDILEQRAQAWSTGDMAALREAYAHDERVTCMDAISEAGVMKQAGLGDVPSRQRQHWLELSLAALAQHPVVFAMLPMDLLLLPDAGYLQGLQAAGYRIEAPDALEDVAPAAASAPPPAKAGSPAAQQAAGSPQ